MNTMPTHSDNKTLETSMEGDKLHFVVLPWLSYGHLSPFLEFSKRIALLGHHVSFLSTPKNIQKLSQNPSNLSPNLHLVTVTLPQVPGLLPGVESPSDDPDGSAHPFINKAFDALGDQLSSFMDVATPKPDWIIYDYNPYWIPSIAARHGVRTAFLCPLNAAVLAFLGPPSSLIGTDGTRTGPQDLVGKPEWVPFDSNVAYRLHEARQIYNGMYKPNKSGVSESFRLGSSIQGCDVVAVRSCLELESEWVPLLKKLYKKPVVPAGLFPSSLHLSPAGWDDTFAWLDKQTPRTVVYIAFGSELVLGEEHVEELAKGIVLSELPFVWAFRGNQELLPDSFEQRTRDRGIVCKGWVPQLKILAHPAVGGFLTHCGWNSLVEAVQFGLTLVLLPMASDEGLNARLMEEKKVGVEVPRKEDDGAFTGEDIAKSMRLVMVEEEGKEIRAKAKELGTVLGKKEVHDGYVEELVKYLADHTSAKE